MASPPCSGGRTVAYIDDARLRRAANSIPVVRHRASLTHELIGSYGLLERLRAVPCLPATEEEVSRFHSPDYVEYLKTAQCSTEEEELSQEQLEQEDLFGLGFDCPVLPVLWPTVRWLAGGSLTGARLLAGGTATTVLNWCGGWHHAQRDSASGFCYVNDIVLAVMELRKRFSRVAYVDLDVHHGDGVENAFAFSRSVLTVSLHLKEEGFFPGTGGEDDLGSGEGRYCSLNVPYRPGFTDDNMVALVKCIIDQHLKTFDPDCFVIQCGGDALALDKLGGANLSLAGYERTLRLLLDLGLPTLVLGGGGYSLTNVARLWTCLTAVALEETLDTEIPEHRYFQHYGPSFDLNITTSNRKNDNTPDHIEFLMKFINNHCKELQKLLPRKTSLPSKRQDVDSSRIPCYKTQSRSDCPPSTEVNDKEVDPHSVDDKLNLSNTSDSAPYPNVENRTPKYDNPSGMCCPVASGTKAQIHDQLEKENLETRDKRTRSPCDASGLVEGNVSKRRKTETGWEEKPLETCGEKVTMKEDLEHHVITESMESTGKENIYEYGLDEF